jgi:hypothetical protein
MLIGQGIGAGGAGGGNGDPSEENTGSAAASYGSCILFPQKSIFDHIALALSSDPETIPFHRVVEACRAAMLHEFVIDLPEGYGSGDDKEGGGGGGVQRTETDIDACLCKISESTYSRPCYVLFIIFVNPFY